VNGNSVTFNAAKDAVVEFVIENVNPGDVVRVTGLDVFGYPTLDPQTLTLKDMVPPTTVLQPGYNAGNAVDIAVAGINTGDGAVLASFTAQSGMTPTYPVTPHMADNLSATGAAITNTVDGDRTLQQELYNLSATSTDNSATAGITEQGIIGGAAPLAGVYDATAFSAWTALSRDIGFAFSEDVVLTGSPAIGSGTATLSGCAAQNDIVVREHDGIVAMTTSADIVRCTVNNVLTMANSDHNKVVDFDNIVTDSQGNAAGDSTIAEVVVKDFMPPFLTKAEYNGTNFIFTFNEPVVAAVGGTTMSISTMAGGVPQLIRFTSAMINSNVVTIPASGVANTALIYANFSNVYNYVESAYGTSRVQHAMVDYSAVADVRGNTWDNWDDAVTAPAGDTLGLGGRIAFTAPMFAMADTLGPFTVTVTNGGYNVLAATATGNTVTNDQVVALTFTHPVNLTVASAIAGPDNIVSAAEMNAFYNLTQPRSVPAPAPADVGVQFTDTATTTGDNLGSWSSNNTVLTFTFRTDEDITTSGGGTAVVAAGGVFVSSLTAATTSTGFGPSQ
jgi:hypothetical protein